MASLFDGFALPKLEEAQGTTARRVRDYGGEWRLMSLQRRLVSLVAASAMVFCAAGYAQQQTIPGGMSAKPGPDGFLRTPGQNAAGMHIYLWGGLKSHLEGQHDYPQWLADWSGLGCAGATSRATLFRSRRRGRSSRASLPMPIRPRRWAKRPPHPPRPPRRLPPRGRPNWRT